MAVNPNPPVTHDVIEAEPQSSVEIESRAKGPPKVGVKVYAPTASAAAAIALRVYRQTVEELAGDSEED